MRVTIATTKNTLHDTFSIDNLKQLSQFREVPVRGVDGKVVGFALDPEIDGEELTVKVVAHVEIPDGVYFSVAYQVRKGVYPLDGSGYKLEDIKLREVIMVNHNFHAD